FAIRCEIGCGQEEQRLSVCGASDEGGRIGGTEAVVDVDNTDVWRAGVEHAEERGCSGEGGSVADGGGDGDNRHSDEAADDTGKRTFHAGADDDGIGGGEGVALGEEPVNAGDANVVDSGDLGAKEFGSNSGFFRGIEIAGPGAK